MRIWYQYPAPLSPFRTVVLDLVTGAIDRVRRPDTEVIVQPAARGAKSTRVYALDLVTIHTAAEIVRALRKSEQEGFDGAVIGQSLDPGLFAAKEMLNIPVTGIGESAAHFASLWGETFGIVTIPTPPGYPPTKYPSIHQRNIQRYGLGSKLVASESLDMPLDEMTAQIQSGRHDLILTQFEAAARKCYERGAEVVIAADTIISVVLLKENFLVMPGTGVVVVDLVTSGIKMIESLVDLHRSLGVVRSRAGVYALPTGDDLASIGDSFDL